MQLAAELNRPGAARARDVSERAGVDCRGRIAEIRVVEQAERFEAELEPQPFPDGEVFENGKINGLRSRAEEQIASGIAVGIVGRRDRVQIRNRERGRIDASDQVPAPAVRARRVNQVRPVSAARRRIRSIG